MTEEKQIVVRKGGGEFNLSEKIVVIPEVIYLKQDDIDEKDLDTISFEKEDWNEFKQKLKEEK